MPIWLIVVLVVLVLILIIWWFITTYNSFIRLRTRVEEGFATMDVYLKQRWDLIPNLVETVKGYAKHEKGTLAEVIGLRNLNYDKMSMNKKIESNEQMSGALGRLLVVVESYPELKANKNFESLSSQLTSLEKDIANSRKYYNATAKDLNIKVQTIPSNIVANLCHIEKAKMFEVTDEAQRENVEVKFD